MEIPVKKLEKKIVLAIGKKYSHKDTKLMSEVVMFGELSGRKSHGIMRVTTGGFAILKQTPTSIPEIIIKSTISKIIKGNGNPGMLVGAIGCEEAIKVAKKNGIAVIGTKESFGSSGSLSFYVEKIAKQGLIGIVLARAPGDVAPPGGLERLFGTNPIAFGIPKQDSPFIFDMATSAISYGAVMRAKSLGEELPDNVAVDPEGKVTKDPDMAIKGAFLTFDRSYKGFGLAMIVEILAGIFPGAGYLEENVTDGWGNLFIAMKPDLLTDIKVFENKVGTLVERVRNSKTVNGKKVRIPGELSIKQRDETLKKGLVDVDQKLFEDLENYIKIGELR